MTGSRFAKGAVDPEAFQSALRQLITTVEREEIPYLMIGGLVSAALGRSRESRDIDILVAPRDAERLLSALAQQDFDTEQTFPEWLFKAAKDGVLIDIIFCAGSTVYLDDEMLARSQPLQLGDLAVLAASAEDLLVTKVASHTEGAPRYWHDALSIISRGGLDWDYLVLRARYAARRVLSLLIYAQSEDLLVPDSAVRALFEEIYGEPPEGGRSFGSTPSGHAFGG
jgi:predicted nucleotidyltransferase